MPCSIPWLKMTLWQIGMQIYIYLLFICVIIVFFEIFYTDFYSIMVGDAPKRSVRITK